MTSQTGSIGECLRGLALSPDGAGLTDAQLIGSFVERRDHAAAAALLHRHGAMVWSVCRRALANRHDAEDAFQATFLVFVRRAATIVPREMVGNWLYGVAWQTARKTKQMAARRRAREKQVAAMPEPAAEAGLWNDLRPLLDEELSKLPDRYRAAIVLCDLESKTHKQAARQLGWPVGTLSARLVRGRAMLAKRLMRRGLSISGGALGTLFLQQTAAAAPPASATSAVLSGAFLAAPGTMSAPMPAGVAAAMNGVLRGMVLHKAKTVLVLLALLAVAVVVGERLLNRRPVAETKPDRDVAGEADKDKAPNLHPEPVGRILVYRAGKFDLVAPDGRLLDEMPRHPDRLILQDPAISPDGKRVAFIAPEQPGPDDRHIYIRAMNGKDKGVDVAIEAFNIAWTPEGKLLAAESLPVKDSKDRTFVAWLVDPDTLEKRRLELPKTIQVFGVGPDDKQYIGVAYDYAERKGHLALVSPDGKITNLTEINWAIPWSPLKRTNPKLSPDGTRILFQDFDPGEEKQEGLPRFPRLFVYDLKTGKRELLADQPPRGLLLDHSWSPDSQHVAYVWKSLQPGVPFFINQKNMKDPKLRTETETHLVVADADGKNPKTLFSMKARSGATLTLGTFDWR